MVQRLRPRGPSPLSSRTAASATARSTDRWSARGIASVALPGALVLILATVIAVRTPLWRDEIASLSFAQLPLPDLLSAVGHVDAVLAPYYLLSSAGQAVLPGAVGLRLPSVLAAALTATVVAVIARRWWGDAAALAAGLMVGLNPLSLQLAATGRPYALATLFVALALLAMTTATGPRGARRGDVLRWAGYAAAVAAAGLMHLFALLALPAFAVLAASRRALGRWLLASAAAVAVVVPVALLAASQSAQVAWIPRPDARSAAGSLASTLTYRREGAFERPELVAVAILLVVAVVTVTLTLRMPRPARARELALLACSLTLACGPWAILLAISVTATPYLRTTYLAPGVIGWGLLVGAAAARLGTWQSGRSAVRRAVAIVVVAAPIVSAAVFSAPVLAQEWRVDDFPGLAQRLSGEVAAGDTLLVVQLYNEVGVASGVARAGGDEGWVSALQSDLTTGTQPVISVRRVDSVDPLHTTASGDGDAERAWVVYTRGAFTPDEARRALADSGCGDASLAPEESFGILRLIPAGCP